MCQSDRRHLGVAHGAAARVSVVVFIREADGSTRLCHLSLYSGGCTCPEAATCFCRVSRVVLVFEHRARFLRQRNNHPDLVSSSWRRMCARAACLKEYLQHRASCCLRVSTAVSTLSRTYGIPSIRR